MTAFYNEIDPFKAAWLRELIKAGLIAPGVVDERDIRDIAPIELSGFTQCHFFAGIGIWSYALRRAGWPDERPVWTGSCPCQPFSSAGKGEGFDDERHLWPAWHWLVGQSGPDVVFGEQVASPDGLAWLDLVSADMEGAGYSGGAGDLCSAGVGASDIRQRLYMAWLADSASRGRRERRGEAFAGDQRHADGGVGSGRLADPARERDEGGERGDHAGSGSEPADGGSTERLVDAPGAGRQGHGRGAGGGAPAAQRTGEGGGMADADRAGAARQRGDSGQGEAEGGLRPGSADRGRARGLANAGSDRAGEHAGKLPGDEGEHEIGAALGDNAPVDRRAVGGLANTDSAGHQPGRLPAGQRRSDEGTALQHRGGEDGWANPLKGFWADADWLLCRDGWWRPVEPGTFPLAHGAPARVGRLRGYGEGINAEVAATFIGEVMELL